MSACLIPPRTDETWGYHTLLDLYKCQIMKIKTPSLIEVYVIRLCALINVKRFGECRIVHFGDDPKVAGYSMVQLIETSLVSGHFCNQNASAFIDIFSCKSYDYELVCNYTRTYFEAEKANINFIKRG